MRTIAIANQKGGCGKTTTAINVAASLALSGHRTLLVDFDPQGHATLGLGLEPNTLSKTMYDVMVDMHTSIAEVTNQVQIDRLAVAPSSILLGTIEFELHQRAGREWFLNEQLGRVANQYDYTIIDCPPQLSLLMVNALLASHYIIVTVQTQYYALEGLKRLLETVNILRKRFHPSNARTLGLLLTFVEDRVAISRQVQQQLREYFGKLVFDTVIHKNTRLAEAPSAGQSILTYAPNTKAASEYTAVAEETKNRIRALEEIL